MKPNKELNPEEWIKTVHTIKHSDLKGETTCQIHNWVKLSENEVRCTKCPKALIVEDINQFL